jgi:ribosome-binding factor A
MSGQRRRSGSRPYQRTTRVNELVREIIADELQVIGDERLELVSVTGVRVDAEFRTGVVFFDTAFGDGSDDAVILAALSEYRVRLQGAIARQARLRRTPELSFTADEGVRAGLRVEDILRNLDETGESTDDADSAPADAPAADAAGDQPPDGQE